MTGVARFSFTYRGASYVCGDRVELPPKELRDLIRDRKVRVPSAEDLKLRQARARYQRRDLRATE